MATCTSTYNDSAFSEIASVAALAQTHAIGYIDTKGWFCFQNECPMVIGNTVVYWDFGHITKTYASELAAPFRAAFRKAT